MTKHRVLFLVAVDLEVNDPTALTRGPENLTDEGVPAAPGEKGWCDYYWPADREDMLHHLAWNVGVMNRSVGNLDGWADLPDAAVTGRVDYIDLLEHEDVDTEEQP